MRVYSIFDSEFRRYGQVLDGYDYSTLFQAAKNAVLLPERGFDYCASFPEIESLPEAKMLQNRAFGGMPIQIGCCFGHNDTLNCLEYHKSSELNLALDPVILFLACQSELHEFHLDTEKVMAFLVPAGVGVELFATTLHYAPCSTTSDGYRVLCVLPRGTNGPKPEVLHIDGEDRLCMGTNKWLLAHPQAPEAKNGAFVGLDGENLAM